MDEDQFRAVYHALNTQRCVFEKAITNRRCACHLQQNFVLASREGVACQSHVSLMQCSAFLEQLRASSRFALRETLIDGPLPHNKELKVQAGGCLALQSLLCPEQAAHTQVTDLDQLLTTALARYGAITAIPYGELVRGVLNYESRRKPARR